MPSFCVTFFFALEWCMGGFSYNRVIQDGQARGYDCVSVHEHMLRAITFRRACSEGSDGSALRDSLKKKGANSYYYAHDGPVSLPSSQGASTSPPPKLLGTTAVNVERPKPIETYSFSDEGGKVKVYVSLPELPQQLQDDFVSFTWTEASMRWVARLCMHTAAHFKHLLCKYCAPLVQLRSSIG